MHPAHRIWIMKQMLATPQHVMLSATEPDARIKAQQIRRAFLESAIVQNLPEATVIPWLGEYGGYCDCEVLANVEQEWQQ